MAAFREAPLQWLPMMERASSTLSSLWVWRGSAVKRGRLYKHKVVEDGHSGLPHPVWPAVSKEAGVLQPHSPAWALGGSNSTDPSGRAGWTGRPRCSHGQYTALGYGPLGPSMYTAVASAGRCPFPLVPKPECETCGIDWGREDPVMGGGALHYGTEFPKCSPFSKLP